jgi:hypothetical protein
MILWYGLSMAAEPRAMPPRDDIEAHETPTKKAREAPTKKVRRFITSLPGFLAGLATVITATATIIGILTHGSKLAHNTVSAGPPPVTPGSIKLPTVSASVSSSPQVSEASASSSPQVSNMSASGAKLQWSGSLVITNDGTDLTSVPPVSDVDGPTQNNGASVYSEGDGIGQSQGTQLLVWAGNSVPTPEQCLSTMTTQASGAWSVQVTYGSVVCAQTYNGTLAIIRVTGFDQSNYAIETRTSLYTPSGS